MPNANAHAGGSASGGRYDFGTVVWAKPKGWPWWPALVVPYEMTHFMDARGLAPPDSGGKIVVEFFGDGRISVLSPRYVVPFAQGMHHLHEASRRYAPDVRFASRAAAEWIALCGSAPVPNAPSPPTPRQPATPPLSRREERRQRLDLLREEVAEAKAALAKEKEELQVLRVERCALPP